MGDYADAAIECFGPQLREQLVPLLSPFRYELVEEHEHVIVTIENLAYGGEDALCQRLRELAIPYEFLQVGDHEFEPRLRLYHPDVPERFGYEATVGEWRGPASANGEPLVGSAVLDRILAEMPRDADDVWLREELEVASAVRWRRRFAARRASARHLPVAVADDAPRAIDVLPSLLGRDPDFTYVREAERYFVIFAVSYDHESDPTDTGERVASTRDAAHWALELTRDGGSSDTFWTVFDQEAHEWTVFEQSDIEEA